MADPKNASLSGNGFRFYRWSDPITGEETDVLSVTSIRKLAGEPYQLVNWQLANIADVAMGQMKRTVIGPRGGVSEKRVKDEFPGEFMRRLIETDGEQAKMDDVRRWLREQADAPRNIAAMRGSIVHQLIEKNTPWTKAERGIVEAEFARLSQRDRQRAKQGVQDEDIRFIQHALRNYWYMRAEVPFTIIAREMQVFNLEAGYAGSLDTLAWFHDPDTDLNTVPRARDITAETVDRMGGYLAVMDWKTATDVHTDNILQVHGYMGSEFVGQDGLKDERLTALLEQANMGGIVHIRPNKYAIHLFDFNPQAMRAFLGFCAGARFLAQYPKPEPLFVRTFQGAAPDGDA